ncbi:hypothetical protein AB833_01585 [Chromatiales bacterium (ex Bugula neritina AB1)]|nr:hypothetical protein AB833_01585 [Chromatiales bacterium (ex Bugula neritina AB1)]
MLELIEKNIFVTFVVVICCLYYFYHSRFVGKPAAVHKFATGVLLLDAIAMPSVVILSIHLIKIVEKHPSIEGVTVNFELLQSGLLFLGTFWLIARAFDVVVMQKLFFRRTGYYAPHLLRGLVYGVALISGLGFFLGKIGYPLTGFLVSTGVIAGVVGLALQNTLGNLFSGIAFSLEQPFKTGDWIQLQDGSIGQVVEMTWRATWLQTFNNTILTMPNLALASQPIINLDRPSLPYSVFYRFKVSPEVDPGYVKTLLATAVGGCRHVLPRPAPSILLRSAVENPYIYVVWVNFRSYMAHFKGQDELFTQINLAFTQAGIHVSAENVQVVEYGKKRPLEPINLKVSDTLRSLPIFAHLNDEEIEIIATGSELVTVEDETELLFENEPVEKIYVVINGELESSATLDNGQRVIGDTFTSGDSFGWSGIVFEEVGFMSVKALSDSLVLAIHSDCIKPVISKHEHLVRQFTDLVTRRINNLDKARSAGKRAQRLSLTPGDIKRRIERFLR